MNRDPRSRGWITEDDRKDIQGFVTSSFGHLPHNAYLFLRFGDPVQARRWLRDELGAVTFAESWRKTKDQPKVKPPVTLNLAFTAVGLRALGLDESCLQSFPPEFREGMPKRAKHLGDTGASQPADWEFGADVEAIHAMAILSASTDHAICREMADFLQRFTEMGGGTLVTEQRGFRSADAKEPFGFRDGIAQPSIRGIEETGVRAGEFILGHENEYGYHPVTPLVRDELDPRGILPGSPNPHHPGMRDLGRNGSYLVYRKLEQDVAGFWGFLRSESTRLKGRVDAPFIVWLAAKMMGRWPSGAPLTLSPERDDPALRESDDFLYRSLDAEGTRCPFGAHIRRTNPRDQIRPTSTEESLHMTARHRILRRGSSYGRPLFDPTLLEIPESPGTGRLFETLKNDDERRGLHFLCINANIRTQFEFIQQTWMNNPTTNGLSNNPDPLSSCPMAAGRVRSMLIPGEARDLRTVSMPLFVTVRAGAYFFMPGRRALSFLSGFP